ncbi:Beclin-1 [Hondaea fermentalgiana]|uniref:Beclin-1 n=1 Tax=Hondaea fermentalgiana TaxID=2315210 RepID=A0A2R5GQB8_9STRA|nr:Beclin-1 [Hondaea fermentalgiana]|eukprot:GBG30074.1 Beclin-1 [Hondaea fermentalgiana]
MAATAQEVEAHKVLVDILDSFAAANGHVDVEEVQRQLDASLEAAQERLPLQKDFLRTAQNASNAASSNDITTSSSKSDNDADDTHQETRETDNKMDELEKVDEASLRRDIKSLEQEFAALAQNLDQVKALEAETRELQDASWRRHALAQSAAQQSAESLESLQTRIDTAHGRRLALMQTHVLNDAFCIWYDDDFGVINGLRLGRLPSVPVEWSEINAAWGQAALLLATLATEVNFSFSKYRVVPMGSASKLAKVGNERTSYELFHTSNYTFFKSSFENAMICILYCVRELGEHAEKTDRTMCLPYAIDGDKVGGLSVRIGGSDEVWTRALKNFLADLKWLLAWSSKRIRAPLTRQISNS